MKFPDLPKSGNGNLFVKLPNDGDKTQGIFRGDPVLIHVHWVNKKSHPCTGRGNCGHCSIGDKAKTRFRINFITKDEGVWVAKIFEGAGKTLDELKALHDAYDLEETLVTVTRSGSGPTTRYLVLPVKKNGGLTDADFHNIAKIPLNALVKDKTVNEDAEPSDADDSFDKF